MSPRCFIRGRGPVRDPFKTIEAGYGDKSYMSMIELIRNPKR
jgi:hypothetical protein